MAKISDTVDRLGRGKFDFNAIWQRQELSDATTEFALDIARHVLGELTSDDRPKANVTEWAKDEQCWKNVQVISASPPQDFLSELVSDDVVRSVKRAARVQQHVDDGIHAQTAVMSVPRNEWLAIKQFAEQHRLLTPTEAGILASVTRPNPAIPTERQAARLMELRQRVSASGYDRGKT